MELWQLVRRVSDLYGRRMEEHKRGIPAAEYMDALSIHQFRYVVAIDRMERPTCGSLAQRFHVTPPTATAIVKKLEGGGYVCSEEDPTDRRQRLLSLTEKGSAVARVNEAAYQLLAEDIRRWLTPEERAAYERLTAKICDRIAELS